jgi:dsRNA-specific ribonuclease
MSKKRDALAAYLQGEEKSNRKRALTVKSYKAVDGDLTDADVNSELATYGDALLKYALSEMLYGSVENITEEKKKYESDEVLVSVIARHYDLLQYIRFDKGNKRIPRDYNFKKKKQKDSPHKYIATTVEALLAAVYLDYGKSTEVVFYIVEQWKKLIDAARPMPRRTL